jgi:hypothetical protein
VKGLTRFVLPALVGLWVSVLLVGSTGYMPLLRPRHKGTGAEPATVLLEIHMPPLALVGRNWSHAERRAYVQRVEQAQEQLAGQVRALGGSIQQRFHTASSGMVVVIAPEQLEVLGQLPQVGRLLALHPYATASHPAVHAQANTPQLPRLPNNGSGVAIAVIDSGADYSHRKLGGPGTAEAYNLAVCGVPGATPGDAACDRPGLLEPPTSIGGAPLFPNGKIISGTDLLGDVWPAPDRRCAGEDGVPQVCPFGDRNPIDLVGHGTHVADIAAGLAIEGAEAGVASGAQLYIYKACNGAASLCEPGAMLQAIDRALDLDGSDRGLCSANCRAYDPADIITIAIASRYGQPEDGLSLFAEIATFYGSLVVAAAGNAGDVPYSVGAPASSAGVLAVAESVGEDRRLTTDDRPRTTNEGRLITENRPLTTDDRPLTTDNSLTVVGRRSSVVEQVTTAGGTRYVSAVTSRGPSIAGNRLKPDLAAPGGMLSAVAGSGGGVAAFHGSSSAAPVAAGVAALLVQELETRGFLDPEPGLLGELGLSLAPHVKAVLVNNADPQVYLNDSLLAPLTRQGGGQVDLLRSYTQRTLAVDTTSLSATLADGVTPPGCSFEPFVQVERYRVRRILPPCATAEGRRFWQAWNGQSPSLSFGYQPVANTTVVTRQITIHNYAVSPQEYTLRSEYRYAEDEAIGVSVALTPTTLRVPAKGYGVATATLQLVPSLLPQWAINAGALGNRASNDGCSDPLSPCASLQRLEVDGFLVIASSRDTIRMPWHVLPRPVGLATISSSSPGIIVVSNPAPAQNVLAESFALIEASPNQCDSSDGLCDSVDYEIGSQPGAHRSPVDLHYIGVRSRVVAGLNASYGLPPAPAGALDDELLEFALTIYDLPYRATPNAPLRFTVRIDAERDGSVDYLVYNRDGGDGRNEVVVRDVRVSDGSLIEQAYGYADVQYNSQVITLPVPAGAVGLRSDQPFGFAVQAEDAYFSDAARNYAPPDWAYDGLWDCSPAASGGVCDGTLHSYQSGLPYALPATNSFDVPPGGTYSLNYSLPTGGESASPSQRGILLIYRESEPGREAQGVLLR